MPAGSVGFAFTAAAAAATRGLVAVTAGCGLGVFIEGFGEDEPR